MQKILYRNSLVAYLLIFAIVVISTALLWSPFILKVQSINGVHSENINFETVLKHWDGPLYAIPAKTLYNINDPLLKTAPLGLEAKYFAAHLPLYPLTIRALRPFIDYQKGPVISTLLSSIALFCFFFYFVKHLKLTKHPLILTTVFMFVTPRFFVIRSVGSPEPLFMLLILVSLFFFIKKEYLIAGLAGGFAIMTKTPAVLLGIAYFLYLISQTFKTKKVNFSWLWLLLMPAGLLAVFMLYYVQYGDFLAYFHSGDNLHLLFPPFQVFNYQKPWVDSSWLEEILFVFFFYGVAVTHLYSERSDDVRRIFLYFTAVFLMAIISVQHRDIARYSLPLLPIGLITFEKFFTSRKFLIVLIFLIPAIYLYAWNFMLVNIAPIADWSPFL